MQILQSVIGGSIRAIMVAAPLTMSLGLCANAQAQGTKPNIIVIMGDDIGMWNIGAYHRGLMAGRTPNIDQLAVEGVIFTDYYAEASCTAGRANFITGELPIRTGMTTVGQAGAKIGMPDKAPTIATVLKDMGYATGQFGKNHLGDLNPYLPTLHGFDEFFGYLYHLDAMQDPFNKTYPPGFKEKGGPRNILHTWATDKDDATVDPRWGKVGKQKIVDEGPLPPHPTKGIKYNMETVDDHILKFATDFMEKAKKDDKPFFVFLPYTQTHMPVVPSAEFKGKSGNGDWGDVLLQIDAYTGRLLDTVKELGVADNTIFIFTSDNGPEMLPGHSGWGGPWRGSYFTGLEGSLRVPFIIRWPGKVPAGAVSNEIVHEMDMYATFAKWTGADIPTDRIIDSVDQSDFLTGKKDKSNRDGFVVYVGNDLFGAKWRNWKMMFKEVERGTDAKKTYDLPRFYNLYADPKEEYPITKATAGHLWVRWPVAEILNEHANSLAKEPPIKPGTPDPYVPKKPQ